MVFSDSVGGDGVSFVESLPMSHRGKNQPDVGRGSRSPRKGKILASAERNHLNSVQTPAPAITPHGP